MFKSYQIKKIIFLFTVTNKFISGIFCYHPPHFYVFFILFEKNSYKRQSLKEYCVLLIYFYFLLNMVKSNEQKHFFGLLSIFQSIIRLIKLLTLL